MDLSKKDNIEILRKATYAYQIEKMIDEGELKKEQLRNIRNPRNRDLYEYLRGVYSDELKKARITPIDETQIENDLLSFSIPSDKYPDDKNLSRKITEHNKKVHSINRTHETLEEYSDLIDLLNNNLENTNQSKRLTLRNLNKFLNNKEHTYEFRKFAHSMQKRWPIAILLTSGAKTVNSANKRSLNTNKYIANIRRAYAVPSPERIFSGIKHDFKGRYSKPAKAASLSLLFAATSAAGLSLAHAAQSQEIQNTTSQSQESTTPVYSSNNKHINSYSEAKQDVLELTKQAYNKLTGESLDLSGITIGATKTPVYTVELNGNTYQFSTMSNVAANDGYFNETIYNFGGEIIDVDQENIAYAKTNDNKYVAISDSNGNSIKDGNILSGPNGQYNPRLLAEAKQLIESNSDIIDQLSDQGIDVNNMSDQELMGVYLFYNTNQNENLAHALGETFELSYYIKNHMTESTKNTYTLDLYSEKSNAIREKIAIDNNTQTYSNDDGFEPGDDF